MPGRHVLAAGGHQWRGRFSRGAGRSSAAAWGEWHHGERAVRSAHPPGARRGGPTRSSHEGAPPLPRLPSAGGLADAGIDQCIIVHVVQQVLNRGRALAGY